MRRYGHVGTLVILTAVAVAISVGVVFVVMALAMGFDFDRPIRLGLFWAISVSFSAVIPMLVTPLIGTSIIKVVSNLDRLSSELERMAETDQLTRLLNRRGFESASQRVLEELAASQSPAALLLCDIDHFKSLNDRFGHAFGDASLQAAAATLCETLESYGAVVARHGGEEFVALLPGLGQREAMAAAEDVRRLCENRAVTHDDKQAHFTMSVGVAVASASLRDMALMMREADQALYRAKREGRNRVVAAA